MNDLNHSVEPKNFPAFVGMVRKLGEDKDVATELLWHIVNERPELALALFNDMNTPVVVHTVHVGCPLSPSAKDKDEVRLAPGVIWAGDKSTISVFNYRAIRDIHTGGGQSPRIAAIKRLRELTSLGLKEAKDTCDLWFMW
jgi:hypothetical protein